MRKQQGFLLIELIVSISILLTLLPTLGSFFQSFSTFAHKQYTTGLNQKKKNYFKHQLHLDLRETQIITINDNILTLSLFDTTHVTYEFLGDIIKRKENERHTTNIDVPEYTLNTLEYRNSLLTILLVFTPDQPLEINIAHDV